MYAYYVWDGQYIYPMYSNHAGVTTEYHICMPMIWYVLACLLIYGVGVQVLVFSNSCMCYYAFAVFQIMHTAECYNVLPVNLAHQEPFYECLCRIIIVQHQLHLRFLNGIYVRKQYYIFSSSYVCNFVIAILQSSCVIAFEYEIKQILNVYSGTCNYKQ